MNRAPSSPSPEIQIDKNLHGRPNFIFLISSPPRPFILHADLLKYKIIKLIIDLKDGFNSKSFRIHYCGLESYLVTLH